MFPQRRVVPSPSAPRSVQPPCPLKPVVRRAVGTWVPEKDYDLFVEIAKQHGVTVSTYLRAIIKDVLAEEGPKVKTLFTKD